MSQRFQSRFFQQFNGANVIERMKTIWTVFWDLIWASFHKRQNIVFNGGIIQINKIFQLIVTFIPKKCIETQNTSALFWGNLVKSHCGQHLAWFPLRTYSKRKDYCKKIHIHDNYQSFNLTLVVTILAIILCND